MVGGRGQGAGGRGQGSSGKWAIAGLIFLGSLILYLATLAPSVVTLFDDSLEFQLVTYQLGIAHPTGYPLYTILGKLFTLLPIGNVAFRVNVMSAVFAAGTVAVVYLLIVQIMQPAKAESPALAAHLGGVSGALLLATSLVFWQQATIAEVYPLNSFFIALLLYLAISQSPKSDLNSLGKATAAEQVSLAAKQLYPIAFIAGLSLTHHRTMVLLFPALGVYLMWIYGLRWYEENTPHPQPLSPRERGARAFSLLNIKETGLFKPSKGAKVKPPPLWGGLRGGLPHKGDVKPPPLWEGLRGGLPHKGDVKPPPLRGGLRGGLPHKGDVKPPPLWGGLRGSLLLLFFLLPLLLYLYLPLRGHIGSLDGTYQNSWAGFWQQVSGGGYGTFLFDNPFGHERDATFYWSLFTAQFYTVLPVFFGLAYLLWQRRFKIILVTGLAFITYLAFNLAYQVSDIEVFFLPNFLLWAIWAGIGIAGLLQLCLDFVPPRWGRWTMVLVLLVGYAIFQQIQTHRPLVTEAYTWQVHDYGLDMLQQPLPDEASGGSTIIGIVGEMTLIRYFQQTEGLRTDIETIAADKETERFQAVEQALNMGRDVYLTRELPQASARWSLSAVGPLIRVKPQPVTEPPAITTPFQRSITPEISLLGYDVARPSHTGEGRPPVRLTLYWQTTATIPADLKISARLLTPDGEAIATVDTVPAHFAYPTTAWRPGEIVSDVYDLQLPLDTPPGSYQPLIIWYDPVQGAAEVGRVELGLVVIE